MNGKIAEAQVALYKAALENLLLTLKKEKGVDLDALVQMVEREMLDGALRPGASFQTDVSKLIKEAVAMANQHYV